MTRVISATHQKITHDMKKIIHDAFREAYHEWKNEGQKNLTGQYTLTVCENVQISENPEDYISVPIEKDGEDGGYLHIYGMKEI